jgi:hypothetical protein
MYKIVSERFEKYTILKVDIENDSVTDWLSSNRHILIPEMVTTAEKILYDDIDDTVPVIRLVGTKITEFVKEESNKRPKKGNIDPSIIIGLTKTDIKDMLETALEWAIDTEEYEIAHRIKLLQETTLVS